MNSQLESLSSRTGLLKVEIEDYESQARAGLTVDHVAYGRAIDSYNGLADEFNRILAIIRAKDVAYKAEVVRLNSMVDRYNKGLK